jgi:Sec-independent protein translocase protein TatA
VLSLSPEKLFIVLILALVLLGPSKLPKLARQLGAGWAKVRDFQRRMEQEVRETMPDLPSSQEIVRLARSPVSYLNSLADSQRQTAPDPADVPLASATEGLPDEEASEGPAANGHLDHPPTFVDANGVPRHQLPADPGMN